MSQPLADVARSMERERWQTLQQSGQRSDASSLEELLAASFADLPSLPASWGAMTPMMVLAILRRRMNDLDGQIAGITEGLDANTRRAEALSRKLEALEDVRRLGISQGVNDNVHLDSSAFTIHDPTANGGAGGEVTVRQYLNSHGIDASDIGAERNFGGQLGLASEQIDSYISKVKQQLSRINSGNEIRMVQLQTAMQQRTQQVSLASNMLKSLDEATSAIIGNIGR